MTRQIKAMQYRGFVIQTTARGDWMFYDIREPNWHHYAESIDEAVEAIDEMYGGTI